MFKIIFTQVATLGDFLLTHRGWFNTTALKLLLCQAASFFSSLGQVKISLLKLFSSIPLLAAVRHGPIPWPKIPQLWFQYLQLHKA